MIQLYFGGPFFFFFWVTRLWSSAKSSLWKIIQFSESLSPFSWWVPEKGKNKKIKKEKMKNKSEPLIKVKGGLKQKGQTMILWFLWDQILLFSFLFSFLCVYNNHINHISKLFKTNEKCIFKFGLNQWRNNLYRFLYWSKKTVFVFY